MCKSITILSMISIFIFIHTFILRIVPAQISSKIYIEDKDYGYSLYLSDLTVYKNTFSKNDWQIMSLPNHGIEFSYPPNACIEYSSFRSRIISGCDTMITISFKGDSYVKFILSNDPFEKFADYFGFFKFLPDTTEIDSIWDFGTLGEATDIIHDNWKGLKGYSAARQYSEGRYVGQTDQERIFLFMERPDNCNIIFSYYMGPNIDLCEDSGIPNSSLNENDFYKIVSSLSFTDN